MKEPPKPTGNNNAASFFQWLWMKGKRRFVGGPGIRIKETSDAIIIEKDNSSGSGTGSSTPRWG